jgi:digeranylgeranylglycerophospholipid reductase
VKTIRCDVLVIGAGPAGGAAAGAAARAGAKVLVAERKEKVGVPVRCGEHIPAPLLGEVDLGSAFVIQAVRGMRTFLPGGGVKETPAPGFIIRRDLFDQALAADAEAAGARLLLSTRVSTRKEGEVFLKRADGEVSVVRPGVIVGADGPHSIAGKWIGSVNSRLMPAIQVRVPLARPLELTEVHFLPEVYGGYAWFFPRGAVANVGLGIRRRGKREISLPALLGRFLSKLEGAGKIRNRPLERQAGWIPAEPVRRVTGENILLAGDAAGQTHPMTGAGIHTAVSCGRMAGEWAARAAGAGNLSLLSEYESEWRDLFGETIGRGFARREELEAGWDRLADLLPRCWVAFREYYARA